MKSKYVLILLLVLINISCSRKLYKSTGDTSTSEVPPIEFAESGSSHDQSPFGSSESDDAALSEDHNPTLKKQTPIIPTMEFLPIELATVHRIAEVCPSFEGGSLETFKKWVEERIRIPQSLCDASFQTRIVLSFVVSPRGELERIKILQSDLEALSWEVLRVVRQSPRWEPAQINGRIVRMEILMSIWIKG